MPPAPAWRRRSTTSFLLAVGARSSSLTCASMRTSMSVWRAMGSWSQHRWDRVRIRWLPAPHCSPAGPKGSSARWRHMAAARRRSWSARAQRSHSRSIRATAGFPRQRLVCRRDRGTAVCDHQRALTLVAFDVPHRPSSAASAATDQRQPTRQEAGASCGASRRRRAVRPHTRKVAGSVVGPRGGPKRPPWHEGRCGLSTKASRLFSPPLRPADGSWSGESALDLEWRA